ncbi:choloylglycine hydrolase [uncultured Ruthenibacterium sp.]|uniref:choloylglycine hydrolase n=1 Tax=uncultured Ruthenibacterium sp. TaxID=1905347 RepID=UPI00349E9262
MCTSISFFEPALFGRNLDLEYSFGEQVVVTPREYPFSFHYRPDMIRHFAMIGMASVAKNVPLYAEAANEKGLYMAGLNFPSNAWYFPDVDDDRENVAPYELIPLVLGTCATLVQARRLLENIRLISKPFAEGYPLAPLHWHIADATGSLVAEPREDGLRIYEDPVGVMTNNPPFPFQLMNLNNYQSLSARPPENRFSQALDLQIYGQGMGALGLPGDTSPMSRFVRAAFLKENAVMTGEPEEKVNQFFHILEGVSMVRGTVITPEGKYDETTYSCCIDAGSGIYYYKTYDNSQISAVSMFEENLDTSALIAYPLTRGPQIHFVNKGGQVGQ